LRKGDYLLDLAAKLSTLRERWVAREQDVATAVETIEKCVSSGDAAGARAALRALETAMKPTAVPMPEVAPVSDEPSPNGATSPSPSRERVQV
jgi:hypothetical protein